MRTLLVLLPLAACATTTAAPRGPAGTWLHPERRAAITATEASQFGRPVFGLSLLNPASNRAYVIGPDSRIDALEFDTGRPIFHSATEGQPFAELPGHTLAVLTRSRQIALLDGDDGSLLFVSAPTAAPGADALNLSLHQGQLELSWRFTVRGDKPCCGGGIELEEGHLAVDLNTGEVRQLPGAPLAAFPKPLANVKLEYLTHPAALRVTAPNGVSWTHLVPEPPPESEKPPKPDPRP